MVDQPTPIPGTDPTFHEFRLYLTPVMHRGRKILAHVASCKQSGCGYSGSWINDISRNRGMFKHRSQQVTTARMKHFQELIPDIRDDRLIDLLVEVADRNSHTFDAWVPCIEMIYSRMNGVDNPIDFEPGRLLPAFHDGLGARDFARTLYLEKVTGERVEV